MGDDITPFIQAKSDQLNADDLIGGPRWARIVNVRVTGGDQQPVTVELDEGKPWKPCKTTMRVLAALWGPRAGEWVGRMVRLYRDPSVKYGGVEVGGIRISGMSHIDKPKVLTLSSSKKTKTEYRIDVLRSAPASPPMPAAHASDRNALARLSADCEKIGISAEPVGAHGWPSQPETGGQGNSARCLQWSDKMIEWAGRQLRGEAGARLVCERDAQAMPDDGSDGSDELPA
jgi:hypothetical protein